MKDKKNTKAQPGGAKAKVRDRDPKVNAELKKLQSAADRAREVYEYEKAIELYTRALDSGTQIEPLNPTTGYDLRSGRAACYIRLGNWKAELVDLDAMIHLAEGFNDTHRQAIAISRKVINPGSDTSIAQQYAEQILKLAGDTGGEDLKALGLRSLAWAELFSGDYLQAQDHLEEALKSYRQLGDQAGEAFCLWMLSRVIGALGDHSQAQIQAEAALALYRKLGDREGESGALRFLGIYASDYAQRRSLTEEALTLSEAIGDLPGQAVLKNNLGLQYARIGLYDTSRAFLESATQLQRELQILGGLAYTMESLGRIYFDLGLHNQAQECFEEGLQIAKERGFHAVEATCLLGIGRLALARKQYEAALQNIYTAIDLYKDAKELANLAAAQAWQGVIHLELGDWQEAHGYTSEAISTLNAVGDVIDEFPPQDVYWLHYQVLTSSLSLDRTDGASEEAWVALKRAYDLVLTNIASLSDAGLRRNYLNKISINRQILLEWSQQAIVRGIEIKPTELSSGNLQEQFKRLLAIGLRMNERREEETLLDFIMDQLVELTGAERTLIVSVDASGERQVMAARGFSHQDLKIALEETAAVLDEVTHQERPLLKRDVIKENKSERIFQQGLSVMSAPLFAGGRLRGVIYVDNHILFEPFDQTDLDLLAAFANQTASALENAQLYQGLEQRVEERTLELQAANAELAVINRVQESLAAELDMQAIYDLVGDQIRDIFNAQVVTIVEYDHDSKYLNYNYMIEKGERFYPEPRPFGLPTFQLIETPKPVLLNTRESIEKFGFNTVENTEPSKSFLAVRLIQGGVVRGGISLQNIDREYAFSESDVRLLSTLANSMSVALENARLFDETNRLLAETEQRAAELSIINSVGEAMAKQLDVGTVTQLVGDKVRDIFNAEAVMIMLHDQVNDMLIFRYAYDNAQDGYVDANPFPFGEGITSKIIQSRQPLLYGTDQEGAEMGAIPVQLKDKEPDELERDTESFMGVPIIIGEKVLGAISVQSYLQHAYQEDDIRLLATLAANTGVAIENARLFEETNRLLAETEQRAAELSIINSVGEAMAKQLDVDTVTKLVGDKVGDIFNAEMMHIILHDQESDMLVIRYGYDKAEGGHATGNPIPIPFGAGVTTKIIQSRHPLLYGTYQEGTDLGAITVQFDDKDLEDEELEQDTESYLGVPIIIGEKVLGVISVQSYLQHAYQEDDLRLLSTLAANMGVAIENARLFEESQRRANEMAALTDIGRDISATLDLATVLGSITTNARKLLAAQTSAVIQLEPDGETLKPIAVVGENAEEIKAFNWKLGQGIIGCIVESGLAEQIENASQDPRAIHISGTDEAEEIERMMVAPLISKEGVSGAMVVWRGGEANVFSQDELNFLIGISRQASIAIQNARLFEDAQRRAREMAALTEIGREISATLDLPTVLERIATRARVELGARDVVLRLLEPDGSLPTVVAIGKYADVFKSNVIQLGQGLTGHVAQTGIAEVVNDPFQDPRMVHIAGTGQEEEEEDEAIIFAPLISRDKVIGVMALWRERSKNGAFTQNDLDFLVGLTRQAAIAIENARLFEEIQRQKQYSDAVVETSPVAIVTTGLDGNIVSWNPGAEKLFQYTQHEVISKNLDSLVATTEIMQTEAAIFSEQAKEGRLKLITKRTRKDGLVLDVELAAVPVLVDEQVVGLIVIYHDITELQGARMEAEAANQAKSAFLATMSHEIRTPMNAVIGMSGLLLDTDLTEEQYEFAEIIRNSGDALLTIINDILDFSKIEAGKMELENQPFDLRDCVEGTLDLVAGKAFDKGLDLAYLIDEQTPSTFSGDMTRLRQILLNLFTNAVKFTETGEVVLTIKSHPISNAGRKVLNSDIHELHFAVRDTGIGIPKERMDRLFQSFSQVDASTARKYGGTGLGLAISRRLSEMMGGSMWAESQEGVGTTFYFTIHAKVVDQPVVARPDLQGDQPQLADRKVLIVDDNETNRRILRLHVEKWGMVVVESRSPQIALEWIRKGENFDVAILDMHMPELDGVMLAKELRQHPAGRDLPLVLFTSLGRRDIYPQGVEFAAHLTKPIKPSQLFDALVSIFSEKPLQVRREATSKAQLDPDLAISLPLRILLTEDNVVNQKLALRLLQKMGYRADVAGNGIEAIQALERQPYDVILMDVQMPEMDGLEATRQINQRWERHERPHIIAMTANAMPGDREMCLAAGMDDYIAKPLRVEEIVDALKRAT